MKLKIDKDIFLKAMKLVSTAVNPKPIIPLLANVLFEVEGDNARLSGTNYEIGISTNVTVEDFEVPDGKVSFTTAMPAKLVTDLVNTLQSDYLMLDFDINKQFLNIKSGTSEHNIKCMNADDFPQPPNVDKDFIQVPCSLFKSAIGRVAFAASADTNSVLNGVLITIDDGRLILFATDGYHLSFETIDLRLGDEGIKDFRAVLSSNTLDTLSRLLDDDGDLNISITEHQIKFAFGSTVFVSQRLGNDFPDYKSLQAGIASTSITVPTLQLLHACKQLELFSTGAIKFNFGGMTVELTALTQERGNSNVVLLVIGSSGASIITGINVFLLHEFLEVCITEEVLIDFTGVQTPILFRMKDFNSYYHIIMPMGIPEQ